MAQRPDYVPSMWTQGSMNRWFQTDPRRVVAWFIVAPAVAVLVAAGLLLSGSFLGWLAALAAVALLWQAMVYLPRALRAARERRP